jgi:hypothetical protein
MVLWQPACLGGLSASLQPQNLSRTPGRTFMAANAWQPSWWVYACTSTLMRLVSCGCMGPSIDLVVSAQCRIALLSRVSQLIAFCAAHSAG